MKIRSHRKPRKNPVIDSRLEFLAKRVIFLLKIGDNFVIALKGRISKLNDATWKFDPEGKYGGYINFSPSAIKEINFEGEYPGIFLK